MLSVTIKIQMHGSRIWWKKDAGNWPLVREWPAFCLHTSLISIGVRWAINTVGFFPSWVLPALQTLLCLCGFGRHSIHHPIFPSKGSHTHSRWLSPADTKSSWVPFGSTNFFIDGGSRLIVLHDLGVWIVQFKTGYRLDYKLSYLYLLELFLVASQFKQSLSISSITSTISGSLIVNGDFGPQK